MNRIASRISPPHWLWLALLLLLAVVLSVGAGRAVANQPAAPSNIWQDVSEGDLVVQGERLIVPDSYRLVAADLVALQAALYAAPIETDATAIPAVVDIPLPDGSIEQFRVWESPVMHPELAAKFPHIRTFIAKGVDDPFVSGRLDLTVNGFHAMLFSPTGTIYVDPFSRNDTTHYVSYFARDYTNDSPYVKHEPFGDPNAIRELVDRLRAGGNVTTGAELRTYRLAVATTGEYSIYHGGTIPLVMAELVTAINRVTGIYEREVAVRMVLIANNDDIIYLDPNTDPYTNNSGSTMLGENQANLDAVIGSANYDIGHVFSTGGGGIASLGVVCRAGLKARGVTGLPNPIGDPFYVDYVAHEMGHQYAANHTFNGNEGACSGANRYGPTAYEPGSGTTIMAYAGICGSQNIQLNSDDYFHGASFDEIVAYTTAGSGNTCPVVTNTGNNPPVVNAGVSGLTIPINTPFALTGSATDPDLDPLTYGWEEFDLGPAGHPNSPVGNAPIFRSFDPVTSPTRLFPQLSDLLNNTQTIGEILPGYARTLTFRLTARDNSVSPSAGGVAYAETQFTVTDQAGPFLVTRPNTAMTLGIGTLQAIQWDVANTNAAPVSCTGVNILLSTDSGNTFPTTIVAGTPNDGRYDWVVPNTPTSTARVKVECANSIFFDISDTQFTIADLGTFAALEVGKTVDPAGPVNPGQSLDYAITVTNTGNLMASATITDVFPIGLTNTVCDGVPGDLLVSVDINPATAVTFDCSADVDGTLDVEIIKSVSPTDVSPGQAVTYTITVNNPNTSYALTNVTVDDPDVSGCTPDLGTPIDLAPLASQVYVCPNVVINENTTNTATVNAEFQIDNVASASAPEDANSPVDSNVVTTIVDLSASDSATVTVSNYVVYLPVVMNGSATATAVPQAGVMPAAGAVLLLTGTTILFTRRQKHD
jgi:uncharacterized repeat protein (TIGR01451 family)